MTINVVKKIFYVICLAAVIAMLFFGYQAYDKKNNYKNSEYSLLTENAYVGGDAYNYIINAGYFAGVSIFMWFLPNYGNYIFWMWGIGRDCRKEE